MPRNCRFCPTSREAVVRPPATLSEANPAASAALEPCTAGAVHLSQDGRRLRAPVRSGGGLASTVAVSLLWSVALLVISAPLATLLYRRRTTG